MNASDRGYVSRPSRLQLDVMYLGIDIKDFNPRDLACFKVILLYQSLYIKFNWEDTLGF